MQNLFIIYLLNKQKKQIPRFLIMITPSRWFNGGKGLDKFREAMLNDNHITHLVDYQNAKDCFPGISIGGGVSYFLWERNKQANCTITNVINGQSNTQVRPLQPCFQIFVRYNEAIDIITKVKSKKEKTVVDIVSSRNPFGLATNARGNSKFKSNSLTLYSSNGVTYIEPSSVTQGKEFIKQYKVMISRVTSEHAGEPDKDGKYKVIAKSQLLKPNEVCTDSYVIACPSDKREISENFYSYLRTINFARIFKFCRPCRQSISREIDMNLSLFKIFQSHGQMQNFMKKYGLTEEEIAFIESMIKPMELGGDDNGN